ncbi:hypothetical protein ISCGN_029490 [Ixodes scapularis]
MPGLVFHAPHVLASAVVTFVKQISKTNGILHARSSTLYFGYFEPFIRGRRARVARGTPIPAFSWAPGRPLVLTIFRLYAESEFVCFLLRGRDDVRKPNSYWLIEKKKNSGQTLRHIALRSTHYPFNQSQSELAVLFFFFFDVTATFMEEADDLISA